MVTYSKWSQNHWEFSSVSRNKGQESTHMTHCLTRTLSLRSSEADELAQCEKVLTTQRLATSVPSLRYTQWKEETSS